jgi:hypothetical protein
MYIVGKLRKMSKRPHEPLDSAQLLLIETKLEELRVHFHFWPTEQGHELRLAEFAYYEGCGYLDPVGSKVLAQTAPYVLGQALVTQHGFEWVSLPGDTSCVQKGKIGVSHPELPHPIDLFDLEGGSWNDFEYDRGEEPDPGRVTLDSLETILSRISSPL